MTYKELLAKINACEYSDHQAIGTSAEWPYKIIRAVVELHKPNEEYPEYCDVCWWEEHERENYPCQTIQAIEKELQ